MFGRQAVWQAQHLKQLWQESELGDREGAAEYMPMSSVRILDSQHPSVKPGSKAADRSHALQVCAEGARCRCMP